MIIYGDKGGYKTDTNTETVSSVVFVAGHYNIHKYIFHSDQQADRHYS